MVGAVDDDEFGEGEAEDTQAVNLGGTLASAQAQQAALKTPMHARGSLAMSKQMSRQSE